MAFIHFFQDCVQARMDDAQRHPFLRVLDLCFIALLVSFLFTDGVLQSVGRWAFFLCGFVELGVLSQRIKFGPMRRIVVRYPNLSLSIGIVLVVAWPLFTTTQIIFHRENLDGLFVFIGTIFSVGAGAWIAVPLFRGWYAIDCGRNRLCTNCGYDRKGDLWTPCPECGYAEEQSLETPT